MLYFTHPQLKFNFKNLSRILRAFLVKPNIGELHKKLSFYFPGKQFVFTDMGRTAFRLILEKLNLRGEEIMLPAYICDIFYPILLEFESKPIFLDIDLETFNASPAEIERKITARTKALLICHTYGLANEMEKIRDIAKKRNLLVIEDIAHTFGAKYKGQYLGNFSDAAFVSLYKQFPSLRGGLAILPADIKIKAEELTKTRFNIRDFFSLLNYFAFLSFLFKTFGNQIAPKFLRKEKRKAFGALNRVSLNLFEHFFGDLAENIKKRTALAPAFLPEFEKMGLQTQTNKNNVFTFLSVLLPDDIAGKRDTIVKRLRRKGIFATRIWHTPIVLHPEVQKTYKLKLAEFPNTLQAAKRIINLPLQNHFTKKDIEKIITNLKLVLDRITG